jgi:PKD repeat protein
VSANVTTGNAPLTVEFSGAGSYDPDIGDIITYNWDLNGDGLFGDSALMGPTYTYSTDGNYNVKLRVTDNRGASNTTTITISVNNLPPEVTILAPDPDFLWRVGDEIYFAGQAFDPETGPLPASQLSWQIVMLHCNLEQPDDCHEHQILAVSGVSDGQFTAIDHEYPCRILIRLTATEPGQQGLSETSTVTLEPELTILRLESQPSGLRLGAFAETSTTPFERYFIVNGTTVITAASPQTLGGQTYQFLNWSDGGPAAHSIIAGTDPIVLTANFSLVPQNSQGPSLDPIGDKTAVVMESLEFVVTASDPDGTVPVLSAEGTPDGATFFDNGDGTGTFSWTPGEEALVNSPYSVTFRASDGSYADSETILITVQAQNRPPALDPIGNKEIDVHHTLIFSVSASDPDGAVPVLTIAGLPPGANFTDNGNGSGLFSWTPGHGAESGSPYSVTFTASDGLLSSSESIQIVVNAHNHAPVLGAVGNKSVNENQLLSFAVSAGDPDGTVPSLSAQGLPAGATFTPGADGTGTFSWTPDFEAAAGSPYSVTFTASDGALSDSETISVTVVNVNRAPVIGRIGNKSVKELQKLFFTVSASDPDGTAPALSAQGLPSNASFVDNGNGTGTFNWTPPLGSSDGSPYTVVFLASDGSLTASQAITIKVRRRGKDGALLVTYPNGGNLWIEGSVNPIYWTSRGKLAGNVRIELWRGGEFDSLISESTPNDGAHTWRVANTTTGTRYKVKVVLVNDADVFDESDSSFTILRIDK